jgi:hypothetical protein
MMKKHVYMFVLSALTFGFAAFSLFKMVGHNQTPGVLRCGGLLLDTNRVYAVSNRAQAGPDTVLIRYRQVKAFMPATLVTLQYDRSLRQFTAKNLRACLSGGKPDTLHPFYPMAHTYKAAFGHPAHYYEPGECIAQAALLQHGIKHNLPYGDRGSRVKLLFSETPYGLALNTREQGLDVAYPLQPAKEQVFGIYNNQKPGAVESSVFAFDSLATGSGHWQLHILAHLFTINYLVTDAQGQQLSAGSGHDPVIKVGNYVFAVEYRYSLPFVIIATLTYLLLAFFQVVLFRKLLRSNSPIVQALLRLRMLLNMVAWMAAPLFLASYYQVPGRLGYLFMIFLFNCSVWFPKDYFQHKTIKRNKWLQIAAVIILIAAPVFFRFGTTDESLFGFIPMLHCQKAVILLLFYITQISFFDRPGLRYFARLGLILGYVLVISLLTHDIGSFIYTALAIGMIELIKKTMLFWHFTAALAVMVIAFVIMYRCHTDIAGERKVYRLIAPYEQPDNPDVSSANEADRESFALLSLDLKNIQRLAEPTFDQLSMPGSMRSTMHTDFAFHTSVLLGSLYFLGLYLVLTLLIAKNLLQLLFCSTRECRINSRLSFNFPQTAEAEFARILLAITLVSFCYPVLSNLMMIPITGQSIPVLSISQIEPVFLIVLFVVLENIFNNPRYYAEKPSYHYTYRDLNKSLHWGMAFVCFSLLMLLIAKNLQVYAAPDTYGWVFSGRTDQQLLPGPVPAGSQKQTLSKSAGRLLARFTRPEDEAQRRAELLNLASLYYSGLPLNEASGKARNFVTGTRRLLWQMSVDSQRTDRRRVISGGWAPYGTVYAFNQQWNGKIALRVTQPYYSSILPNSPTLNADLTAETNERLAAHLLKIGSRQNVGAVVIVDNRNGGVVVNSSYPLDTAANSNRHYYLIGSLKKMLVAYAALKIDPAYSSAEYGGKTFAQFLANSDDHYPAYLLKDLLSNHRQAFSDVLEQDFGIPLITNVNDGYLDAYPTAREFNSPLNNHNSIYRTSIGQQHPYQFIEVIQWYARLASHRKLILNYDGQYAASELSLPAPQDSLLKSCLNGVITRGTAAVVGQALLKNHLSPKSFFGKTGTAEAHGGMSNSSSSLIIADEHFTIGIMLSGQLPANSKRMAAKDLFIQLIPVLIKYGILQPDPPAKP